MYIFRGELKVISVVLNCNLPFIWIILSELPKVIFFPKTSAPLDTDNLPRQTTSSIVYKLLEIIELFTFKLLVISVLPWTEREFLITAFPCKSKEPATLKSPRLSMKAVLRLSISIFLAFNTPLTDSPWLTFNPSFTDIVPSTNKFPPISTFLSRIVPPFTSKVLASILAWEINSFVNLKSFLKLTSEVKVALPLTFKVSFTSKLSVSLSPVIIKASPAKVPFTTKSSVIVALPSTDKSPFVLNVPEVTS